MLRTVLVDRPLLGLSLLIGAKCHTDLNVIMNAESYFIELKGATEEAPFSRAQLNQMLDLAEIGIAQLIEAQGQARV